MSLASTRAALAAAVRMSAPCERATSGCGAGAAAFKWALRYVFPDHWSFLLGEIALYSFIVLVITGIFLTLYYVPSDAQVIYHGTYPPLLRRSRCPRPTARCCTSQPQRPRRAC